MSFFSNSDRPKPCSEIDEAKNGLEQKKSRLKRVREALQSITVEEPPDESPGLGKLAMLAARAGKR